MGGRIRLIGALALALGLLLVAGPATAQGDSSVDRARQWLDQQRKPNGSFDDGVFNPVDLTSNAVMGELAAGSSPAQATLTWLRDSSAAAAYARKGPGAAAKLALALESGGGRRLRRRARRAGAARRRPGRAGGDPRRPGRQAAARPRLGVRRGPAVGHQYHRGGADGAGQVGPWRLRRRPRRRRLPRRPAVRLRRVGL